MTNIVGEFLDLSNFQRAWEKVAENRGCAGVDGETIDNFASNQAMNIYQLQNAVANGTYQPRPCKQVIIPKKNGSKRELKIPTVRDRIVQQALLNAIYPVINEKFSTASFAYRPNLSYLNAVEKVAEWRDLGYRWILDADITKFFDNIDHQRLLKQFRQYIDNPGILCLIKSWVSTGILTDEGLIIPSKGIPQGAVISPMLANIYLDEFDKYISTTDLQLVRYADDFLVLCHTQERILQAKQEITNFLNTIGLIMNLEKTQVTNFERGFRFLGHGFLDNAIFPIDVNEEKLKSTIDEIEKNKSKKKVPTVSKKQKSKTSQR